MESKNSGLNLSDVPRQQDQHGHDDGNAMLSVSVAARLLGIHPNTVRIWTESGVIQSYRIGPRKDRRIPASAVQSMLKSD